MSELRVSAVTDETGGNTATINGMTPTADSLQGFRNRIINGDMRIDQRNAGASVTITNTGAVTYTLDRMWAYTSQASKFSVQQNAGSITPPTGFSNYLGITSLSAYSVTSTDIFEIGHRIEGFNTADLAWGTANAAAVTLSFWVRSSLTGTFGGAFRNSAANRSYPFTYTVSAANTWEQKTVTVAGDTSGTWVGSTNGTGLEITFGFGVGATYNGTAGAWATGNFVSATGAVSVVGTSGATFRITGVQLEAGSVATPFERRPYGTELQLCQRYAYVFRDTDTQTTINTGYTGSSVTFRNAFQVPVPMRTLPTVSATGSVYFFDGIQNVQASSLSGVTTSTLVSNFTWNVPSATGQRPGVVYFQGAGNLTFTAEL